MKARISRFSPGANWWLYAIVILLSVFFAILGQIYQFNDTQSYISAWTDYLSKGHIDPFRTPVYPMYLGVLMLVNQSYFLRLAVIGQHIVFVISVFYLMRMLLWFNKSDIIVSILSLIYVLLAVIYNNLILTESFAISGTVFLFYCLLSYYRTGNASYVVWSTVWLAFLIFLRPAFLYLFVVCVVAWALFCTKYGKKALLGLAGVAIVGIMELGYCTFFEKEYDLFLPSNVGVTNNFQIAILEGAISPDYSEKEEVQEYINGLPDFTSKSAFDLWDYLNSNPLPKTLSVKEEANIVSKSRRDQPDKWILGCLNHFFDSLQLTFPVGVFPSPFWRLTMFMSVGGVCVFLMIYFIFCGYAAFIRKRWLVLSIILWLAVTGNLVTVIIGAQADWSRLLLPSLPLLVMMAVQFLGFVNWRSIGEYDEGEVLA